MPKSSETDMMLYRVASTYGKLTRFTTEDDSFDGLLVSIGHDDMYEPVAHIITPDGLRDCTRIKDLTNVQLLTA